MATLMTVMLFGTALAVAIWAIVATIAPRTAQILDLLRYGPVGELPALPPQPRVRGVPVRVRAIRAWSPLREAA